MVSSGVNRSHILEELETAKPKFGYEYHAVVSTAEYFVQPNSDLAESFKTTLEAISGTCIICKTFTIKTFFINLISPFPKIFTVVVTRACGP